MNETRRITGSWAALAACVGLAFCAGWGSHLPSARAEVKDPKGVAVVVGNRNYRNERVPEVSYAHRDAAAFRRYVVEVLGYDRDNILYIEDADQARLESVFGNERSHEGLLWRYLDPEGGSDVVVFYSGHGVPGLKDKRSYLLPVNADPDTAEINGYPIDVLYGNLSKLEEARSVRLFLDACFSGDSDRGMLVRAASPVYVKAELPEAFRKLTVLTAASGQELASWDEKARHGLFTHHLLNALHGAADDAQYGEKDGRVTAAEAKRYLDRHMTRAARRTFGRHQRATLAGDEAAVLAAAVSEGFPARAEAESGSGSEPVVAAPTGAGKTSPSVTTPSPAAVEEALSLGRDARVLVQRGLGSLKFEAGPVDGLFGKKTREAIKAWQEAKGFEGTGYLTKEQTEALKAVGRAALKEERKARELAEKARVERERLAREAKAREEAARRAREEKRPGRVFRDCEGCPEMVVVPAGSFRMGSPSDEDGRNDDEGPIRWVRIGEAFAVGKYEVTRGEYREFVRSTGRDMSGGCYVYVNESGNWKKEAGRSWKDPGFSQGGRNPVVCVSWEDAKGYVEWLSEKTGKGYRLLTEAEWEYAARAGTTGPFHTGSTITTDEANYDGSYTYGSGSKGRYRKRTVSVGTFQANGFGLHDVHGNVWEWVEDCWHGDYSGAPTDGSAWVSGGDCSRRVLRGGSWLDRPRILRSADRYGYTASGRIIVNGFRIARTLTP